MKLIVIAPYQNSQVRWGFVLEELVASLRKRGQLEGVELDIDEGPMLDSPSAVRDEEFMAVVTLAGIRKAKEYSESNKYDAIVFTGGLDPGFAAARANSKIPVAAPIHSSVHFASLIGERFSIIAASASGGLIVRKQVERYGFAHKLASVRNFGFSSTHVNGILKKYKKADRANAPEARPVIDAIFNQGVAAIEKERADTLILSSEPQQALADEVRQKLDEAGYSEIPLICSLFPAVEMAKAMVNMKWAKAPRAYPDSTLKAKPEYW